MKGARPIQWLWDWLGQGSLGEQYEVLPLVQPTVDVNGLEMPPMFQYQAFTTALVAPSASVSLAPPRQQISRLIFELWISRTAQAAGDRDDVLRTVNGKLMFLASQELNTLPLGGIANPMIGGFKRYGGFGATLVEVRGRSPVLSTFDAPVSVQHLTTIAVGNFAETSIIYVDVPSRAVLPAEFLL